MCNSQCKFKPDIWPSARAALAIMVALRPRIRRERKKFIYMTLTVIFKIVIHHQSLLAKDLQQFLVEYPYLFNGKSC